MSAGSTERIVALQVSAFDNDDQTHGWSVSITGAAHGTPDPSPSQQHPTAPWIPQGGGDLIAISTDIMFGERLGPADNASPRKNPD